jgi:medium-chain acyl-[acyl-carrier-protein] hydrolase
MGALIAFHLSRHLRVKQQLSPRHLFVSAAPAPQQWASRCPIHQLPDSQFIAELRRLNGMPTEAFRHEELLQLLLPTLRADFAVCEEYLYTVDLPLPCPISAYGGRDDQEVGEKELKAWTEQTNAGFTIRLFPGDHFFLRPARESVLRAIAYDLGCEDAAVQYGKRRR